MSVVNCCDVKEIITYEHENWYAVSQDYHGYYDNQAWGSCYVQEVLDGHDAVVLEFIVKLA